MIIFGHQAIEAPRFRRVENREAIKTIPANEVVFFESSSDKDYALGRFCYEEEVAYAVQVNSLTELLIYAALGAKFAVLADFLQSYQKIAEHYLLDTKILTIIERESQIEEVAKLGIDGVVFSHFLG